MHFSAFVLCIFTVLLISMEHQFVSGKKGVGCGWGGCEHFSQHACTTGATGGEGRYKFIDSARCGIGGRKRLCCDPECDYQACGRSCADLGMDVGLPSDKPPVQCTFNIPGFGEFSGSSTFCCP